MKKTLEQELIELAHFAKEQNLLQAENFIQCVLTQTWIKDVIDIDSHGNLKE